MAARLVENVRHGRVEIDDAADILGVTPRTLYDWRARGYGPKSVKYMNRLWYSVGDIENFLTNVEAATAKGSGI